LTKRENYIKNFHDFFIFVKFCLPETGNKVVEKGWPTEAVGVVVRIDNKIQVFPSYVSPGIDIHDVYPAIVI
jgi:hypothetical protein